MREFKNLFADEFTFKEVAFLLVANKLSHANKGKTIIIRTLRSTFLFAYCRSKLKIKRIFNSLALDTPRKKSLRVILEIVLQQNAC